LPRPFKVPIIIIYLFTISGCAIIILAFFKIDSNCSRIVNQLFIVISFAFLIIGIFLWFGLFYWCHLKDQRREEFLREIDEQVEMQAAIAK